MESCAAANFIDPSTAQFASCATAVESALGLIERIAPGFRAEIEKLVECVVLVDEGASFRGASGLAFRGMIMLSPEPDWTTCTFAEELVHEMTHLLMDLISIREPLLKGEQAFDDVGGTVSTRQTPALRQLSRTHGRRPAYSPVRRLPEVRRRAGDKLERQGT